MSDTTASLGIETKVIGADKTKSDLAAINLEAKGLASTTKELGAQTTQLGQKMQASVPSVKQFTSPWKEAAPAVTATAQSMSLLQRIMQPFSGLFGAHANATDGATSATTKFREVLHTVNPIMGQFGGSMMGMERFSRAATAGLAGLAIAIGGVFLVAIENTVEKLAAMRQRIMDLTPSGSKAFEALSDSARKTGVDVSALSGIFETFLKAERDFGSGPKFVGFGDLSGLPGAGSAQAAVDTLGTILRGAQLTREEIGGVSTALKGIGATGQLTRDVFRAIEDASPGVAKGIAMAFGTTDIKAFTDRLTQVPIGVRELESKLAQFGPTAEAALKAATGGSDTMASAMVKLHQTWDNFAKEIGDSHIGTGAIDAGIAVLNIFIATIQTANALMGKFFSLMSHMPGSSSLPFNAEGLQLPGAMGPSFDATGLTGSGISDAANSIEQFATGGLARVVGSGGTDRTLVQFMATNGEIVAVGNSSAAHAVSGATGFPVSAITQPITMAVNNSTHEIVKAISNSTIQAQPSVESGLQYHVQGNGIIGAGISNIAGGNAGYFANGGSFKVGGIGGTDSQLVRLHATPGETVTVSKGSAVDTRPVIQNIYMMAPSGPGSFASPAQLKRAMKSALRA